MRIPVLSFRRIAAGASLLLAAAPAARAQSLAARPSCDVPAPPRVAVAGGRVTLVLPEGLRALTEERYGTDTRPELVLRNEDETASAVVYFLNEVARVDSPTYKATRRRVIETLPQFVRWIVRDVVEHGGARWLLQEFTLRGERTGDDVHFRQLFTAFDGRTLRADFAHRAADPAAEEQMNQVVASLEVRDCAPAAALAAAGAARRGDAPAGRSVPVCEERDLRAAVLAGGPRRAWIADGRVSLVPPEVTDELTSVEIARMDRKESRPLAAFAGDSVWVSLRLTGAVAEVDSPAYLAAWVRRLEAGVPANIGWIARDVVELGGRRWLHLDLVFRRGRGGEVHEVIYATSFLGGTLIVSLGGPPRHTRALEESVATLVVRDCAVARPLEAWVDSAALARAAAALPAPPLPAQMKPIFRVTFDTAGAVERVEPVYAQIPADYAAAATAAIRANLKPQPRWREPVGYLVRVMGGDTGRVDNPEVVERSPMVENYYDIARELGAAGSSLRFRPGSARRAAPGFYVRMRVLADGRLDRESIQPLRTAGVASLDGAILRIVREIQFTPGEVDGFPAVTWAVIPLSLLP
jgi:hypothetical protein